MLCNVYFVVNILKTVETFVRYICRRAVKAGKRNKLAKYFDFSYMMPQRSPQSEFSQRLVCSKFALLQSSRRNFSVEHTKKYLPDFAQHLFRQRVIYLSCQNSMKRNCLCRVHVCISCKSLFPVLVILYERNHVNLVIL